MYSGRVQCTKWDADFTFLSNMIELVENAGGWLRVPRMHIIWLYFQAVRKFGIKLDVLVESEFLIGFRAGRKAALMSKNTSGCSCVFDEDDNIVEMCFLHKMLLDQKDLEPDFSKVVDDHFWELI